MKENILCLKYSLNILYTIKEKIYKGKPKEGESELMKKIRILADSCVAVDAIRFCCNCYGVFQSFVGTSGTRI